MLTPTYNRCIACHCQFKAGAAGSLQIVDGSRQYDLCPEHGAQFTAVKSERQTTDVPDWAQKWAVLEEDYDCPHPTLFAGGKPAPWFWEWAGRSLP